MATLDCLFAVVRSIEDAYARVRHERFTVSRCIKIFVRSLVVTTARTTEL